MDPRGFVDSEELLRFFHCKKTELSCMEKPHTFLTQLRDHDLIPEDGYQKVSRMKSKENQKKAVYEILDWLERKKSKNIAEFWRCVFEDTIVNQYPTLRLLRNSLMDGSFREQLPEKVEEEWTTKKKRKDLSEEEDEEEKQLNTVKKKKKLRSRRKCDDDDDEEEEQPGPSSQLTPGQRRKSKKICFSPLKKGENNDLWTWDFYRSHLPVTCGGLEGTLFKKKLAKGESCISFQHQWFTPGEFEKRAGKASSRNWKLSIRCNGTTLGKLIEGGHLKSRNYKGGCKKVKKSLFPRDQASTVSDEEESEDEECEDQEDQTSSSDKESSTDDSDDEEENEEQPEQQQQDDNDRSKMVFKVTCGALEGTLHEKRFASGTRGKSIRTETRWMSPVEFAEEASGQTDVSWKRDIECEGKPLSVLIQEQHLSIHSPLCDCRLCKPDQEDLDNQKNDDECCVCKSDEEAELVVCDHCPRSFHQKCHLPEVEDALLGDDTPWMCTFCLFRTVEQWRYGDELEMQEAMSLQISRYMLECEYLLLYLYSADEEQMFASNPNLCSKNDSTAVQTPMWFGKVADKLQKKEYHTVEEFVSDVQLIFTNSAAYSRDDAEFLARSSRLKELFDGELKKVFNISVE